MRGGGHLKRQVGIGIGIGIGIGNGGAGVGGPAAGAEADSTVVGPDRAVMHDFLAAQPLSSSTTESIIVTLMMHTIAEAQSLSSQTSLTKYSVPVIIHPLASGMAAATAGVAFAAAADEAITRVWPSLRTPVAACGLIGAAAIYPLSGRRPGIDGREAVTLALACIVVALAASMPGSRSRRLLAAGWVAHALYDAAFTHDADATRLPEW
ncbi:hypothetical protein AWC11_06265 [Mycobacterium interjectum]|nr:hypothetical protein AWC11_06265 [Mycobacterium interjectum]